MTIKPHVIQLYIGTFTVTQKIDEKTGKWKQPVISHGRNGVYYVDTLHEIEKDLMKTKNIVRILENNRKNQNTPEAYTLEQLEKQIRLALGEVE